MFAAHLGDHAKTARVIAAFGNFYVSEMRRCKPEAGRIVIGNVAWTRCDEVVAGIGDAGSAYVGLATAGITDPGYNAL